MGWSITVTFVGCAGGPAVVAASVEASVEAPTTETGISLPSDTAHDTGCDTPLPLFVDVDGDGVGAGEVAGEGCAATPGWSFTGDDCDDGNAAIHPGASDFTCGGYDRSCDGVAAALCVVDVLEFDIPLQGAGDMVVDVTGDGFPDVVGSTDDALWIAPGPFAAGVLVDATTAVATYTVDTDPFVSDVPGEFAWMHDLTGDGRSDLWLASSGTESSLFEGPVSGDITPYLTWPVVSVATGDVDGDGFPDVLAGDTTVEQVYLIPGPLTPGSLVEDAVLVIDDSVSYPGYDLYADETFGDLLAVLGDENGDGVVDFVAMDSSEDTAQFGQRSLGSWALRVFDGTMRGVITPQEARVNWYPEPQPSTENTALTAAIPIGDLNQDGFDDLMFPGCSDGSGPVDYRSTAACISYGPLGPTMFETASTYWDIGSPPHALAGSATLVPDLDGDGVDDLATKLGEFGGLALDAIWIVPGRSEAGHFDVLESAFWALEESDPASGPASYSAFMAGWTSTFDFGPDGRPMDWDGDGIGDPWLTAAGVTLFDTLAIQ